METEAIVLDTADHGESDMIVTMFSLKDGKIVTIAKGAKKSLRRFVNKLEIFSFLHVVCNRKSERNLAFLAEADLHASFMNLRRDFQLYSIASVVREFLLLGTKDDEPDERLFRLSLWTLHSINRERHPKTVLIFFLIRYFDYLGYRPDLQTCGTCNQQETFTQKHAFDAKRGQIVCANSHLHSSSVTPLSEGTIRILRMAQDQPLEKLHRIKVSGTLLEESLTLLHAYGRQLYQRDFTAWKMMNKYFNG